MYYVFGTGFPKSLNIGKAVDKLKGNSRKAIGKKKLWGHNAGSGAGSFSKNKYEGQTGIKRTVPLTRGNSPFEGWGTALKPAVECWWLCRKPLSEKTIAENVLKWGVGGINIDGCRIECGTEHMRGNVGAKVKDSDWKNKSGFGKPFVATDSPLGRFPSHLIHNGSPEALAVFPHSKSGAMKKSYAYTNTGFSLGNPKGKTKQIHGASEGSAARFFYCAKASRREREMGCSGIPEKPIEIQQPHNSKNLEERYAMKAKNNHPTVKPIALMKYLVKLITPPNGLVLDMFAGSGSTLIAAKALRYRFIGIEKERDYCEIARKRIASVQKTLF